MQISPTIRAVCSRAGACTIKLVLLLLGLLLGLKLLLSGIVLRLANRSKKVVRFHELGIIRSDTGLLHMLVFLWVC